MFSEITNIYNKKTKGPTLVEFFTAIRKLKKKNFLTTRGIRVTRVNMLTRVWQKLENPIDVCRVTRGEHIEHL